MLVGCHDVRSMHLFLSLFLGKVTRNMIWVLFSIKILKLLVVDGGGAEFPEFHFDLIHDRLDSQFKQIQSMAVVLLLLFEFVLRRAGGAFRFGCDT